MDEPTTKFIDLEPATTRANALILRFQTGRNQQALLISRNGAERLKARLEEYLRMVRSQSAVKKL